MDSGRPQTTKPAVPIRRMTFEHVASMTLAAICGGGGIYGYMQNKSVPSLFAGVTLGSLYGLSAYRATGWTIQ